MLFRYRSSGLFFARKFSSGSVVAVAAAASVSLFLSGEQQSYRDWATLHYGSAQSSLAARKVISLPPLQDLQSMSRIVPTADDDFFRSIQTKSYWRTRGGKKSSKYIRTLKRSGLIGGGADNLFFDPFFNQEPERLKRYSFHSGVYRTMCVRTCDGFMWPVSFSTGRSNLGVDEKVCRSSCAAPTRLYFYENPGQTPDMMIDRQGRSYNALPTAWRYKQEHVSSCKCRPDPWEAQAMARHVKFAALRKQGRLKRFLRQSSRKAKRLSRRASIGRIVVSSSLDDGFPDGSAEQQPGGSAQPPKPGEAQKQRIARGSIPRIIKPKRIGGFGRPSKRSRARALFSTAFGSDK